MSCMENNGTVDKSKFHTVTPQAKKILIVNTTTKLGETKGYSVNDFVNEVEKYIGCSLDYVLYNKVIPNKDRIEEFKKEEPVVLGLVRVNDNLLEEKFIGEDFLKDSGPLTHDPEKVIKTLVRLI